jgi:hypothetical protein
LIERVERVPGWGRTVGFPIPVRRLVEVDFGLRRSASGGDAWAPVGEAEVAENVVDDVGLGEEGEDAQNSVAAGTAEGVELVDAREELGPADAGGGG